jgi:integrase
MRLYLRNRVWYLDYRSPLNGRRVRRRIGYCKKDAELALKEIELKILKGEFAESTEPKRAAFNDLCKEYLTFSKAHKTRQSHRRDTISVKHLLKIFRGKLISQITARELDHYMNLRRAKVKPATVNREFSCIKHMFTKAIQWGYLSENPLQPVKKFKEPPGRVRYLMDKEIDRLLASCAEHIKPMVIMALNTGMRKGEILSLKWSDIDLKNRMITVKKTKNNETRMIPINGILYHALRTIGPELGCQHVFTNHQGKSYGDITKGFKAALKRARIDDFRFHDLRHTFASRLVMAGVDIRTVQELLGHRDITMTMRYSHLSSTHLKEAVKRLEVGTEYGTTEKQENPECLAKP